MSAKKIWLFGENRGQTMDNNSWHTYKRARLRSNSLGTDSYFVLESTPEHRARTAALPQQVRDGILWRDSRAHHRQFRRADRFFITLSFGDIEPSDVQGRSVRRVPLVHLQHGTIGVKQVGYRGDYYRGTIEAFCVYTREEIELLEHHNGFRREQLFRLEYPPRYGQLLRMQRRFATQRGRALWFLTWRDYLEAEIAGGEASKRHAREFIDAIVESITTRSFTDALTRSASDDGLELVICLHQFFPRKLVRKIKRSLSEALADYPGAYERVRVTHASDVDLMRLMVEAEMLITDYSSLAYDMTFLGKSVCMYLFDVTEYLAHRTTYIDLREVFTQHVAYEPEEFAEALRSSRNTLHNHYAARVRPPYDSAMRQLIIDGRHIDPLLNEMAARDLAKLSPTSIDPLMSPPGTTSEKLIA